MKVDYFERVYYKVIDYDTNEVVFEKAFVSQICRTLGINSHHFNKMSNNKKGYYANNKTNKKYKFIKLEDEII